MSEAFAAALTDPFQLAGLLGVACYLFSYTLLQLRLMSSECIAYSLFSVIAASLVLLSLTQQFNLPSATIQVSWIVLGTLGMILRLRRRRTLVRLETGETL